MGWCLQCWTLCANFSTKLFHTCHAYRDHGLLPFYITFADLDPGWNSQGQQRAKPLVFIFSHTFQMIKMKFDLLLKQFRLNVPILFWARFLGTREITAVILTVPKNFIVGMHLDIYETILSYSKLWHTSNWLWPWFNVTGVQEITNFCASYLTELSIDLDGVGLLSRLVVLMNLALILSCPFSFQEREPTYVISLNSINVGLYSDI